MKQKNPVVGIIMGSDSDLPVMAAAAQILDEFDIAYECEIVSAHRTPKWMFEYASSSVERGIKTIIAGAGGAAHLPGMVASMSPVPVIGVPVQSKTMSGIDSLYSIVQMPPGVPVATVAINGARNAGLLAIQILAVQDHALLKKFIMFREKQTKDVILKSATLRKVGYREYLKTLSSKK